MVYDKLIEGRYVALRAAEPEDAQFTLGLRQDAAMTRYLPRLDITVAQQRRWIEEQRQREGDYFFVATDKGGRPIGTIRVYGIDGGEGETGSLALKGNAFENMEARLLCEQFAFETLGLERTRSVVHVDNIRARQFAEAFGVVFSEPRDDPRGFVCRIGSNTRERSALCRAKIAAMLYRGKAGKEPQK